MTDAEKMQRLLELRSKEQGDAPAAPQQSYMAGLGRSALQGLSFSTGDEALAYLRSHLGDEDYDTALGDERAKLKGFEDEHPIASGFAEVGGGLPLAFIPGLDVAAGARSALTGGKLLAQLAARGVAYGAGAGALSGAGAAEGDLGDRGLGALKGALIGAGTGVALPLVAKAGSGVTGVLADRFAPSLRDQVGKGRDAVLRAMGRDQVTLDDLRSQLAADRKLTVPSQVLDGGDNLTGLAETVAQYPGHESQGLVSDLEQRAADQRERVANQVNWRMVPKGKESYYQTEQDLIQQMRSGATDLYDQAYAAVPEGIMTPKQQKALQRLDAMGYFKPAISEARQIAAGEGKLLGPVDKELSEQMADNVLLGKQDGSSQVASTFSTETWDRLKQGIDELLQSKDFQSNTGGLTKKGQVLKGIKNDLVSEVDEANPAYKAARAKYAGDAEMRDALYFGHDEATKLHPDAIADRLSGMSEAEQELAQVGFAKKLEDGFLETSQNIDAAKKVINSPRMKQRLEAIFPDEQQRGLLVTALERESELQQNAGQVTRNSATARRLAGKEDLEGGPDLAGEIASHVTGGAYLHPTGGGHLVLRVLNAFRPSKNIPEERVGEIAKILRAGSPDEVDAALTSLEGRGQELQDQAERQAGLAQRAAVTAGSVEGPEPKAPDDTEEGHAKGGKVDLPSTARRLAAAGRGHDTILAHINPDEAELLKQRGGSGTINPKTGLLQFDDGGGGDGSGGDGGDGGSGAGGDDGGGAGGGDSSAGGDNGGYAGAGDDGGYEGESGAGADGGYSSGPAGSGSGYGGQGGSDDPGDPGDGAWVGGAGSGGTKYGGAWEAALGLGLGPATPTLMGDPANYIGMKAQGALDKITSNPVGSLANVAVGLLGGPLGTVNTLSGLMGGPTIGGYIGNAINGSPGSGTAGTGPTGGATTGSTDAGALGSLSGHDLAQAAPSDVGALSTVAGSGTSLPSLGPVALNGTVPQTPTPSSGALTSLAAGTNFSPRTYIGPTDPQSYYRFGRQPFGFYRSAA